MAPAKTTLAGRDAKSAPQPLALLPTHEFCPDSEGRGPAQPGIAVANAKASCEIAAPTAPNWAALRPTVVREIATWTSDAAAGAIASTPPPPPAELSRSSAETTLRLPPYM